MPGRFRPGFWQFDVNLKEVNEKGVRRLVNFDQVHVWAIRHRVCASKVRPYEQTRQSARCGRELNGSNRLEQSFACMPWVSPDSLSDDLPTPSTWLNDGAHRKDMM
jgi:hypothetical protein